MVARATARIFDVPLTWAGIVAVALEAGPHKVVQGWLRAKTWNATKRKTDARAPTLRRLGLVVKIFAVDVGMVAALAI